MYKYLLILLLFFSCKSIPTVTYEVVQLDTGTFDVGAEVIYTEDTIAAKQYIECELETTIPPGSFYARGLTFNNPGYPLIMWLPKRPVTPEEISTANHELFHMTIGILTWAGVELNESTEEVFCFEMQYLSKQFYK